jgi:hypothetical protein
VQDRYKLHLITSVSETSESRTGMHYGPITSTSPPESAVIFNSGIYRAIMHLLFQPLSLVA